MSSLSGRIQSAQRLVIALETIQAAALNAHGVDDKSSLVEDPSAMTDQQILPELERINEQLARVTPAGRPRAGEVVDVQARQVGLLPPWQ